MTRERVQFAVARGVNLQFAPCEFVGPSNAADRAVQADLVVVLNVAAHHSPRIRQRDGRARPPRVIPCVDFYGSSVSRCRLLYPVDGTTACAYYIGVAYT